MTVKELFNSLTFDDVINALRNTHRNDRSIESVVAYKEAFDTIRLTEFGGNGGEVSFDVTPREKWSEPGALPLIANNVEGDYWENTVGKTIIRPADSPFTDAELAGAILWGMTFYGFTRHARWSPFEKHFTSYGKRAERLNRKLYLPYIRDKREKRHLKSEQEMPYGIAFTKEVWNQIRRGKSRQNRAKRKRYYRLKKRIAELKRLDKRQHLIDSIHEECRYFDRPLENRILSAGRIIGTWRDSHVADISTRTNYLEDLLTNYFPTFRDICEGGKELLIVAYTSETTPLTDEETRRLKNMLRSFEPELPITFIRGIDNEAKTDIALRFIIISDAPSNNNIEG